MTTFSDNKASEGGAIYSQFNSNVIFRSNCEVTFNHNLAEFGGAVVCYKNSRVIFNGNSIASFNNNIANTNGGAIYSYDNSYSYILKEILLQFLVIILLLMVEL